MESGKKEGGSKLVPNSTFKVKLCQLLTVEKCRGKFHQNVNPTVAVVVGRCFEDISECDS
jgi:hypothetical protein